MDLPLLPETVRLTPAELKETENAPVYVFRPVSGMEQAAALVWCRENEGAGYARTALEHLIDIEGMTLGGQKFDQKNERHVAALDGMHLAEMGAALLNRTHLTEQEQGKSSSPSESS